MKMASNWTSHNSSFPPSLYSRRSIRGTGTRHLNFHSTPLSGPLYTVWTTFRGATWRISSPRKISRAPSEGLAHNQVCNKQQSTEKLTQSPADSGGASSLIITYTYIYVLKLSLFLVVRLCHLHSCVLRCEGWASKARTLALQVLQWEHLNRLNVGFNGLSILQSLIVTLSKIVGLASESKVATFSPWK